MKIEIIITVTNHSDPSCQRLTLIEHHEIDADGNSSNDIRDLYDDTERRFRELFPRGMSYNIPFTTIEVNEVVENVVEVEA